MKRESREIALAKQVADLRAALGLAREASKDMRRAGRAEALAILLAHGAEGIGDFIGSHSIADTGDYGDHWEEGKLRELLDLAGDDPTLSLIDRMEGQYWDHVAEIELLRAAPHVAPALMPVIYVDANGQLVSRVSAEQVEAVLGPVVDEIRSTMARQEGPSRQYAGEGPISALYGIKYFATTLSEAKTLAGDAMATAQQRKAAVHQAEQDSKAVLPSEPLWDRKGNVIHAAVDRLGAAQRAAAAAASGAGEATEANDHDDAREVPRS